MVSNLFNNNIEEKAFYNLIAARKYFHKSKEKQLYDADIEEYLHKCDEILKENNARCNFIAEILARKDNTLKNGVYSGNNRLSEIEALTKEFIDFLKNVPLIVKEDLEFYSKRIDDRLQRNAETLLEQQNILEYYPKVDNIDYNEAYAILAPIFDNIASFGTEKETDYKEDLTNQEGAYVEPIFSLLDYSSSSGDETSKNNEETLLEEAKTKYDKSNDGILSTRQEVKGIKTLPVKEVVSDIKEEKELNPFVRRDKAMEEIKFEKENQVDPDNIYVTNSNFDLSNLEQSANDTFKGTLTEEPEIPLDTIVSTEYNAPENNVASKEDNAKSTEDAKILSFTMRQGITLAIIASEAYGDSTRWEDIRNANETIINEIVNKKNNGNFNGIENDPDLFTGVNIKIPTELSIDTPKSFMKTV